MCAYFALEKKGAGLPKSSESTTVQYTLQEYTKEHNTLHFFRAVRHSAFVILPAARLPLSNCAGDILHLGQTAFLPYDIKDKLYLRQTKF